MRGCLFKKPLIQIQMLKVQTGFLFLLSKNEWRGRLALNPKIPTAIVKQRRGFMIIVLLSDCGIGDSKWYGIS